MDHDSMERGLAFLCHPYHRGGVTTWMAGAAREWKRRGRPCWFVAPAPGRSSLTSGGRSTVIELLGDDQDSPTVIAPHVGASYEFGTAASRAAVLRRALAGVPEGVPVIVSNDPDVWLAAVQMADRHPIVGVLHADEEAYYALARRYAGSIAALVAVSARIAARAKNLVSMDVAIIPCGIPVAATLPVSPAGDRALRLVWAGRVEEHQKRVSDLVKIAERLRHQGVDFQIRILGDGPDREALRASAAEVGVADRLVWNGWSSPESVRVILRESDVLLLPSNFEGMPVAAMEALAEGCAVVASRVSGIEDYEHEPRANGCLRVHAIGDVDEAATAVMELASAAPAVRRQRAWNFAHSEFDIGVSMNRYERVMDRVHGMAARSPMPVPVGDEASWQVLGRAWLRWIRTWVAQRA